MEKDPSLAKLTPDATLSQIIAADRHAAELLASIGLNPFDHKNQSLRSVCQQRQWSEVEVLKWIKKQRRTENDKPSERKQEKPDYGDNLSGWCEYLHEEFHSVNLKLLEEISNSFPRVHQIHGNQYPWLKNMQWYFERFEEAVRMYYEFEAKRFYPLVNTLQHTKGDLLDGTIRKLKRCLEIVHKDQSRLLRLMKTISENGNKFENPGGACSTLRILNQNFKTLFTGLNKQFKVEKESLLPLVQEKIKAKDLEN
ncbi:MAG TPA: hypothetical protein VF181_07700 [Balneolaceae bacterium]